MEEQCKSSECECLDTSMESLRTHETIIRQAESIKQIEEDKLVRSSVGLLDFLSPKDRAFNGWRWKKLKMRYDLGTKVNAHDGPINLPIKSVTGKLKSRTFSFEFRPSWPLRIRNRDVGRFKIQFSLREYRFSTSQTAFELNEPIAQSIIVTICSTVLSEMLIYGLGIAGSSRQVINSPAVRIRDFSAENWTFVS